MANYHKKLLIIWIDPNINNEENQQYIQDAENLIRKKIAIPGSFTIKDFSHNEAKPFIIHTFKEIEPSITFIKSIRFQFSVIIVSGTLFVDFVTQFQNNLNDIYIIPKIIIFTSIMKNYSLPLQIDNQNFYLFSGIKLSFEEVAFFIYKELVRIFSYQLSLVDTEKISLNENLIIEKIENWEDLVLPVFNSVLIDNSEIYNNQKFINYFIENYKNTIKYNDLVNQLVDVQDIPVPLLSKYYVRLIATEDYFYEKMRYDFLNDNNSQKDIYLPFVQTIYSGLKQGALKPCTNTELYSAQFLNEHQIQELLGKNTYKKQVQIEKNSCFKSENTDIPNSIIYSQSFMTLFEDFNRAEYLLTEGRNTIITIIGPKNEYYLINQIDIKELSLGNYGDALLLPFSAFGIDNFVYDEYKQRYSLRLIYLGQYCNIKQIKKSEQFFPNTLFKTNLEKSGLIQENKMFLMKIKDLSNELYINRRQSKSSECCFIF